MHHNEEIIQAGESISIPDSKEHPEALPPPDKNNMLKRLNDLQGRPLRFLLVLPKMRPSFWSMHHLGPLVGKKSLMAPIGLLTIAALCPPDWEIRILDENVDDLTDEEILWADLVGVSSIITQYAYVLQIAKRLRRMGKPSMIGGPHVSIEKEAFTGHFDVMVAGEGEITFRQFLGDYAQGKVLSLYETDQRADVTATPIPRFDLLRHPDKYFNFNVQFSRGCPYECDFCSIPVLLGQRHRTKHPEQVLRELDGVFATGYKGPIFFVDDNFIANPRKSMGMCEALKVWNEAHGNPFTYFTQADFTLASNEELMEAMKKARFNGLLMGVETPDQDTLRMSKKQNNVGLDIPLAVRKIQTYGLRVDGCFIVGFDTDTEQVFDMQARYIEEIGISCAMPGILIAPYRSKIYQRLRSEGRLLREKTEAHATMGSEGYNVGGILNVIPKNFSLQTLLDGYAKLLSMAYEPGPFFRRALCQISRLKPTNRNLANAMKYSLIYFPYLSFQILIRFPFRFHYLRAALLMLLRHPNRLEDFVFLTARGIHYMEFARLEAIPWAKRESRRFAQEELAESN